MPSSFEYVHSSPDVRTMLINAQAAHRMARFPPEPSVDMTVKLTRTAYAQLVGQKFYPPKVFGRWTEPEDSPEYKTKDLGMKIARMLPPSLNR